MQFDISTCIHWYYLRACFIPVICDQPPVFSIVEGGGGGKQKLVSVFAPPLTCSVTLGKAPFNSEHPFSFHAYKEGVGLKLAISNWLPTGHIWHADIILLGS